MHSLTGFCDTRTKGLLCVMSAFKTKLGKQMHEVDLNTRIASINRQVTFCCGMLRIQQITKIRLHSWEMGISWEAFSFLVLSFIASTYDVLFAISEIEEKTSLNCQICGQKQCIQFCCQKSQFPKPTLRPTPLSLSPTRLTQPHL